MTYQPSVLQAGAKGSIPLSSTDSGDAKTRNCPPLVHQVGCQTAASRSNAPNPRGYLRCVRRRVWIGLTALAAAAALTAWTCTRHASPTPRASRSRLDVAAFRARLAMQLQRAKQIAARQPEPVQPPATASAKTWPDQGTGPVPDLGKHLIEPQCVLGPHELRTSLAPLIARCDAGDARDCLAIGQFLDDTPPRSGASIAFFRQACRIGDAAGCARVDELQSDAPAPCERDPVACSWRALRSNDRELHDESCSLGVAAGCAWMAMVTEHDADVSRGYLETGCQLGDPAMCMDLGRRLQPGCESRNDWACYEPDPEQARAAIEIACAAGWERLRRAKS